MATGFLCVWCEKPLLDSDHSKKHVVEQCEKAPHAKLRADLALAVAEVERLRVKVAELEHIVGGLKSNARAVAQERFEYVKMYERAAERADKADEENTRLMREARRWYLPGGASVDLEPGEVTRRRMLAAEVLDDLWRMTRAEPELAEAIGPETMGKLNALCASDKPALREPEPTAS